MLKRGQTIKLVEIGEAVRATLREPGATEQPPVFSRRPFVPSIMVAGHGVFGREGFDVGGAADEPANRAESAFASPFDVLENVSADDKVAVRSDFIVLSDASVP